MMITVDQSEIKKHLLKNDFDVLKIKTSFDIKKIAADVSEVLASYGQIKKDKYEEYVGLGLQYSNEENPLYDAIPQFAYIDQEGIVDKTRDSKIIFKKNAIGEKFSYIFEEFRSLIFFRGRILTAKPNIKMSPHTDGEFIFNVHVPVFSNPQAKIFIDNKDYYLEPDGSLYVVNATKPHYIVNKSLTDRVHIIFTIGFLSFKNWTQVEVDDYVQKYSLQKHKEKLYQHNGLKLVDE